MIDMTGEVNVQAQSDERIRVIAGSLAAGQSEKGMGITIAFTSDHDSVLSEIGGSSAVTAGYYSQSAKNTQDILNITVAGAAAKEDAVGGAVTAIASQASAKAGAADKVKINVTTGNIDITSATNYNAMLISASAATSGEIAGGGTIALFDNDNSSTVYIGNDAYLTSDSGNITITADMTEWLFNILASASAANSGTGVAGAIGILVDSAKANTTLRSNVTVETKGDILIGFSGDVTMLNIFAGLSYGKINAVGMTLMINKLSREILTYIGPDTKITSSDNSVTIRAIGKEWSLAINAGLGISNSNIAAAGSNCLTISSNSVETCIAANTAITSKNELNLISKLDEKDYIIGGAVSVSLGGKTGIGETVTLLRTENKVYTTIADHVALTSTAVRKQGYDFPGEGSIIISAKANESLLAISVSGSAGGKVTAVGVVHGLYETNDVQTAMGTDSHISGSHFTHALIEANDKSDILDVAGGLSAGTDAGVGATVMTVVFEKNVVVDLSRVGYIDGLSSYLDVNAVAEDNLYTLAVAFAAGNTAGVAGDLNLLNVTNTTKASLGGSVNFYGFIKVNASSNENIYSIGVGVSGGGTAGVAGVVVLTFFGGTTSADIASYSDINAQGYGVSVLADSKEYLTPDLGGLCAGGTAAAVTVDFQYVGVMASLGSNNIVDANRVWVQAISDRTFNSYTASIAAAGTAAVGVNASALVVGGKLLEGVSVVLKKMNPSAQLTAIQDVMKSTFSTGIGKIDQANPETVTASCEGDGTDAGKLGGNAASCVTDSTVTQLI